MMDTAVVTTDLDRLAERIERAAGLVHELREKTAKLEQEKLELTRRLRESDHRLQGQDPGAMLTELAALRKEQRDWQSERREVASRIETLLKKLERLEA